MKIIFLNKNEETALIRLLTPLMTTANTPYELTTILEKLNWRTYEYAFKHPKEERE
jgi:hypothetical protein